MKIYILIFVIFIICTFSFSKKKIDQEITLLKNGKHLSNVIVFYSIQGKKRHFWHDPTITGNWDQSYDKLLKIQEKYVLTDSRGKFSIKGKGISLGISIYYKYGIYELIYQKLSLFKKIPNVFNIEDAKYLGPIFSSSEISDYINTPHLLVERYKNRPLLIKYFNKLKIENDILYCLIKAKTRDKQGIYRGEIPFEIMNEKNNSIFIKSMTDAIWENGIRDHLIIAFVPKNSIFTIKILPHLSTNWFFENTDFESLPFKNKIITGIKPTNDINNPVMTIELEPIEKY